MTFDLNVDDAHAQNSPNETLYCTCVSFLALTARAFRVLYFKYLERFRASYERERRLSCSFGVRKE